MNAARVADRLARLRDSVRETVLTSWEVEEALGRARSLAHAEQERCTAAGLRVQGVWLGAAGKIAGALAAAVFVAFLVLVFADLLQTFFDTASHTGALADTARRSPPP